MNATDASSFENTQLYKSSVKDDSLKSSMEKICMILSIVWHEVSTNAGYSINFMNFSASNILVIILN